MPPIDPNNPPQGPGNQPPLKPDVQKLRFEDVFDVQQIEDEMKRVFRVSKVIESEEKKSAEIHMKYLKIVQTAERHKHTLLVREKKEMLKMLEDEMRIQKNLAMGAAPHGPERVAAGKKVEAEFAAKAAKVEAAYKPQIAAQGLRALASEGSGVLGSVTGKLAGLIEVLPKLTTAMGAMSGIVTGLIAVFQLGTERLANLTKLEASLRAGGMGLGEAARSVDSAQKVFNIMGQNMEELGQSVGDVDKLVAELGKAPDVLDEIKEAGGPEAWKGIRDAMLKFGVDAQTTADMIVETSRSQKMSLSEVSRMYVTAAKTSHDAGINFKDAFNSLLNMNAEMRNLTFNTDEARKIFVGTTFALRNLGDVKFSQQETLKFANNVTQALGSMTVDKLIGVLSFIKGRMPSPEEISKGLGFEDIITYFKKLSIDTAGKLPTAESLAKIAGGMENLGISLGDNPKESALAMYEVLKTWNKDAGRTFNQAFDEARVKQMSADEKSAKKAADEFKKAQEDGFKAARQMVPPLNKLATALETFANKFVGQFADEFSTFADNFDKFVKITSFNSVSQGVKSFLHPDDYARNQFGVHHTTQLERDMTRSARARRRAARNSASIAEDFKGL